MQDLQAKGAAWLAQQRRAHASHPARYGRGDSIIRLPVSSGRSQFEVDEGGGILIEIESHDFLITPSDLRIDGVATEPLAGDRIEDGGVVYEVMPFGNEPAWRWADIYRQRYRVHSKQVDKVQ